MSDLRERTRFDPAEVEPRISEAWRASGLHHPEPAGEPAENFSIAIPPPNVTGSLHMGHALNNTIQDVLARTHRMRGERTKWIFGTDHAGIATQRQVEKALEAEGTSRQALGREAFVERVWEWTREYGGTIRGQLERLGATLDFQDERFTMDERYVRAVLQVFVELYDEGLIYRDDYLVNWDPGLGTAVSDLEVDEREGVVDELVSIAYPLADGDGEVVVATVRPETMLADTAVAVHPDDERYRGLLGREVVLPLVGRRLPVIADPYVKTEFGTGALKITPGHDPNDFEIGRRHDLEVVSVIGEDGRMRAEAGRFAGLPVEEARGAVLAALEEEGAVRGRERYVHTVPHSHRSGARIEPLVSRQWFMRMDELARPAIEAVTSGRVRIHPESQARRYVEWLEGIRPWCVSRQLWWGHQIPVWYRGEDEVHVGLEAPEGGGWARDEDVLDTWFSSQLWPFATLGWPDETPELAAFYPTDVLSTARDILFLWVARMVMMGLRFRGDVPFTDVYVHSVIQAPDGRRMSKSLGTGIDPIELIDRFGADATRFGLLAMSSTQDVRFSEEKIAQGQALVNKLFNATRLVLTNVGDAEVAPAPRRTTVEDRFVLSRLQAAKEDMAARVDGFDFAKAALGLYDFVHGELCDWYLEMAKPRLYAGDEDVRATLLHVLRETVALAHPVIPFVTEELWGMLGGEGLLAAGRLPGVDPALRDAGAEEEVGRAIAAVTALRGWRDRVQVRPGAVVPAVLQAPGYEGTLGSVAHLARMDFGADGAEGPGRPSSGPSTDAGPVASVAVPGGAVGVLPSGEVDLEAAERRLEARREELRGEVRRAEGKLANEAFVTRAPAHVVEAERTKLARLSAELEAL